MKKRTQRFLSLVLALVMVFGFVMPVYAQPTGERPGDPTAYNFDIDVTLNGLRGLVDGEVYFYLRGQTLSGEWLAYEFDQTAFVVDGEGNAEVTIPATIVDDVTGTEYAVADLNNLEIWAGIGYINEPVYVDFFGPEQVNPEYLDKYDDEMYWETFPVADLTLGETYDIVFDIVHTYPEITDEDFTIRVVDRNGRGLEGAPVTLYQVEKGDDADYALDENGDYIVDEAAETMELGVTDARGYLVLSPAEKQAAAAFLGAPINSIEIVGALRAAYGNLLSSTTFVNFAAENNKALIVMSPRDTFFKVTVVTRDDERPFRALPGATVRIVENVGELWGHPAMGNTLATLTTDAYGEVDFRNINLTNSVYYNIPDDIDEFDELIIKRMIRNNWLVVEAPGYDTVERLITGEEIELGEAVVPMAPSGVDHGRFLDRIWGDNRYETAVEVAKRTFTDIPDTFILASGEDFADALVANGLTNVLDAPILLTRQGALPEETRAYLEEAKAEHTTIRVHIIGGHAAISGAVEGQIEREFSAVTSRMYGDNRYETAAAIARYMYTQGVDGAWTGEALVANGRDFPDAIIASLPAAQYGKPILLTGPDELHPITFEALNNTLNGERIYHHATVIGGNGVISDHAYGQINMVDKERLWGNNRYLTSLEALRQMYPDATKLYVVSGTQYTDALVAAKLAADNNAAILLVHPSGLSAEAEEYLRNSAITDITLIGGVNALPESIEIELAQILLNR